MTATATTTATAVTPAIALVVLTDGSCLNTPPKKTGNTNDFVCSDRDLKDDRDDREHRENGANGDDRKGMCTTAMLATAHELTVMT